MSYVEPTGASDRAHRQPGYPLLLALAEAAGFEGAPALARVNLAVLVAALWIAFAVARVSTGSVLAAVLAAAAIADARFLMEIATGRLLTEPLYVAVAVGAAGACLSYLIRPGPISLLAAAALSGAAYLVRVNGLFLAIALAAAMIAADLLRSRSAEAAGIDRGDEADDDADQDDELEDDGDLCEEDEEYDDDAGVDARFGMRLPVAAYGAALALFVVVTVPSWLPRVVATGNPIYHGYLMNFVWVDSYERAHVPGPAQFTAATYISEHDFAAAAERLRYGVRRVFVDTPRDKYGFALATAIALALGVLVALRNTPGLLLAAAAVLQAMPLAWTALANPARRLPAAALLPFAALLIAAAVAAAVARSQTSKGETD